MSNIARLRFTLYSSVLSGYSEIPNNHFFVKFTILEYMLNMLTYIRFTCLVQVTKLLLSEPHSLLIIHHIKMYLAILALVDYYVVVLGHYVFSLTLVFYGSCFFVNT